MSLRTVINTLLKLRQDGATTLNQARKSEVWSSAIKTIARTVSEMSVQYLQNFGGVQIPFLYQYPHPPGKLILHHGVASMLRTFHPLIQQLSRAGWVAHIRKNKRNTKIIGQVDELEMFMFGTPRASLNPGHRATAKNSIKQVLLLRFVPNKSS